MHSRSGPTSRCNGRRFASIEISAILKAEINSTSIPIYNGGAAERWPLGGSQSAHSLWLPGSDKLPVFN
jgi:hypothetical protein